MFMMAKMAHAGFGGRIPAAGVEFAAFTADAAYSGAGTKTFAGHAIGTASGDRYVVVFVNAQSSTDITSVTVAGQSTTRLLSFATDSKIYVTNAAVPSGTTADIAVTNTGAGTVNMSIGVWAVTRLLSNAAADTASDSGSNPASLTVDVPAGGVIIACARGNGGAGSGTWSVLTERFDSNVESGHNVAGGDLASAAGGSLSPGFTWGAGPSAFVSGAVVLR
jgi:hypothetical protein